MTTIIITYYILFIITIGILYKYFIDIYITCNYMILKITTIILYIIISFIFAAIIPLFIIGRLLNKQF